MGGSEDAVRRPERGSRRWPRWEGRAPLAESYHVAKRVLVGRPKPSRQLKGERLPKRLALPVFASDPLSSVAYATEQALLVLLAASLAARALTMPIALAIAGLMAVVVASYRLTVQAYSSGGGAYVVASDNLGTFAGLLAAAALLVDYVLTVAVSVSAGTWAITSAAQGLLPYQVALTLAFVAVIALVNLRGVREAGKLFALPTYGFVVAVGGLIVAGLFACAGGCPRAEVPDPEPVGPAMAAIGVFVVLHAFASGATALTGIEAISNGVSAFRRPQGRNAAITITILGALAATLFLGVSLLAWLLDARPSQSVSVLSEIARAVLGESVLFYVVQAFTFAILVLAANTAYQGFPRLAALLARDDFLPHQFRDLGDRLVQSNGVVVLTAAAAGLIWAFGADPERLIQLYVIGVFTGFTLSQAGMVVHWLRGGSEGDGDGGAGGRRSGRVALNAAGAVATGLVAVVVLVTKFAEGAWMVVVAVPALIALLYGVHRHYRRVARLLSRGAVDAQACGHNLVVLYVDDVSAATDSALAYLRLVHGDELHAIHVRDGARTDVEERWRAREPGVELELLDGDGSPATVVLDYVRSLERGEEDFVTVVIPELLERPSLRSELRRPAAFWLKVRLLGEPQVVIADVPLLRVEGAAAPAPPQRTVTLVLVSSVDDASVRAVGYARSLAADDTRAVFVAEDPGEETEAIEREWSERDLPVPLSVVEGPYRELGGPVLEQVRAVTDDPRSLATVVVSEVVAGRHWHNFLHNGEALYLKWLLLFEPRVVLASVPHRLDGD